MLGEHLARVLLVRLKFCHKYVHFLFFNQENVAGPLEHLMSLPKWNNQVNEVTDEATQLIEDEVGVLLKLHRLLLFLGLHETLQALEALLEDV